MDAIKEVRLAGILVFIGMCTGIFSVAPAIDSPNYLTQAAKNSSQVILGAAFQFAMSLSYIGVAILLYPNIKKFGSSLSTGFLSLRIIAVSLSVIGTLLLVSILTLSQGYAQHPPQQAAALEAVGNVLKISRDYVNHVFMILMLCSGNFLLNILFFKSKLMPRWLSGWGMGGAFLSMTASILFMFRKVDVLTFEYLVLNVPTAIQELVLGTWLIVKGFDKRII